MPKIAQITNHDNRTIVDLPDHSEVLNDGDKLVIHSDHLHIIRKLANHLTISGLKSEVEKQLTNELVLDTSSDEINIDFPAPHADGVVLEDWTTYEMPIKDNTEPITYPKPDWNLTNGDNIKFKIPSSDQTFTGFLSQTNPYWWAIIDDKGVHLVPAFCTKSPQTHLTEENLTKNSIEVIELIEKEEEFNDQL